MKNWYKYRLTNVLWTAAVLCVVIILIQSPIYYERAGYSAGMRVILTMQNLFKAFRSGPSISLTDMYKYLANNPGTFDQILGRAYYGAVLVAPLCTFGALYKALERFLNIPPLPFKFWWHEHTTVFGCDALVKKLIEENYSHLNGVDKDGNTDDQPFYRIHLVVDRELSTEETRKLRRRGVIINELDIATLKKDDREIFYRKCRFHDKTRNIYLMDPDPIKNLATLQALSEKYEGKNKGLTSYVDGKKIFLRCGDEGAYKLIEAYADVSYGLNDKDKPGRGYDLEIVDPAELEVRKMFIETPFHTYYENMENRPEPDKWDLHILILGFDKIGQQTLLQAMSLGVTAPGNRIIADIVDKDMDKLRDSFMNRFAKDAFIETEPGKTYKINNGRLEDQSDGWVEGEVTLRFHREDVRNSRFHADLEKMCEEVPFTYVVVSVNRAEPTTRCLSILHGILAKSPAKVPVYVKMEADDQYRRFVESQQSSGDGSSIGLFSIPGLDFIEDYSTWISFKELNDSGITEVAKLSNKYYGYLYNVFLKPGPFNAGLVSDDDWLKRKLYQRDLTRYGVLYYRNVLDRSLFNAYGDPEEYIRDCFDNDENSILLYDPDDREWDFNPIAKKHEKEWNWSELIKKYKEAENKETEELLEKVLSKYLNALLEKNGKAWAIIRTEQRRVTNHRISKGWAREDSGNDRDKILKKNPNIMEWNEFLKQHPESVKTNFMCLMLKYKSLSKKQA